MLMIRLQRVGRTNDPSFRLVVVESKRGPKSGAFLEVVGSYDPRHKDKTQIKTERVRYWLSQGVQLSDTVHNIFVGAKIIEGKKINVVPPPKAKPQEASQEAVAA